MSWANAYIGIASVDLGRTISGCDCWGLARLVYANELQISLPSYANGYACSDERQEIAALINDARATGPWLIRQGYAQCFDLLVFRQGRYQSHIAIALNDKMMLHVAGEDQSKVERFDQSRWKTRLIGAYQHKQMAARVQL